MRGAPLFSQALRLPPEDATVWQLPSVREVANLPPRPASLRFDRANVPLAAANVRLKRVSARLGPGNLRPAKANARLGWVKERTRPAGRIHTRRR
jgi:hypothetical protein